MKPENKNLVKVKGTRGPGRNNSNKRIELEVGRGVSQMRMEREPKTNVSQTKPTPPQPQSPHTADKMSSCLFYNEWQKSIGTILYYRQRIMFNHYSFPTGLFCQEIHLTHTEYFLVMIQYTNRINFP